jgi:protease-4
MNESLDATHPQPAPEAAGQSPRRLILTLIGLYAACLVAAGALALRNNSHETSPSTDQKISTALLGMGDGDSVGYVSIHGVITASDDDRPWQSGGVDQWADRIKDLAETKGVKAIVLDIDSPGGSVGAVQELYSQIERVRAEKKIPIVALFGDVAASGGYYIASACDKIVAHPGTLTGSIGVIFPSGNLVGLFQKIGYKSEPIKSGKFKDIGSPAREMTPAERSLLQALIMDAYSQFLQAVSEGRHLPVDQVRPLADGRIFSGHQALGLHLVDALGDSTDAIDLAGKLGGIHGKPKVRRSSQKLSDILGMLDSQLSFSARFPWLSEMASAPSAGLEYLWQGN